MLYSAMKTAFESIGLDSETFINKVVGLGCDGDSVNLGHKNGLIALMKRINHVLSRFIVLYTGKYKLISYCFIKLFDIIPNIYITSINLSMHSKMEQSHCPFTRKLKLY